MKAIWNGDVIAESSDTVVVEGNHYFPAASLRDGCFEASARRSNCAWKGEAHYYDIVVGDARNEAAAFYYPMPRSGAGQIADRVAFWKGVEISD